MTREETFESLKDVVLSLKISCRFKNVFFRKKWQEKVTALEKSIHELSKEDYKWVEQKFSEWVKTLQ